jgi:large conductance mechanosensitive channel
MATQKRNRKAPGVGQVVAVGTPIRFEKPKSSRKKAKASDVAVVVAQEINPVSGFGDFLKQYAVVGLAIGFIVGLQAQDLVRSLVTSFIDPTFQLLFGDKLQNKVFHIGFHGREQAFMWGTFVRSVLYFLFVLAAIFVIVKLLNLDKFGSVSKDDIDKHKEKKH